MSPVCFMVLMSCKVTHCGLSTPWFMMGPKGTAGHQTGRVRICAQLKLVGEGRFVKGGCGVKTGQKLPNNLRNILGKLLEVGPHL